MSEPARRFPLAPMCPLIRWLTVGLLLVPVGMVVAALREPAFWMLVVVMGLLYASVWVFWRPRGFEVTADGLAIRFPFWTRVLPAAAIQGAREMTRFEFRQEFGWALRIGVGGLWGGFGWLWTRKKGMVEFYVSRVDGLVVVDRPCGKALLVTPSDPAAFVRAVVA